MRLVKENKIQAEKEATKAKLWTRDIDGNILLLDSQEALNMEIARSFEGLRQAGIGNELWLQSAQLVLERNLEIGSPSERLSQHLIEFGGDRMTGIISSLEEMKAFK